MLKPLELKIPPLILLGLLAVGMWFAAKSMPGAGVPDYLRLGFAIPLAFVGVIVMAVAVKRFVNADTTVNPADPSKASVLVTTGIYQYTRNPMYLGQFCLLLAWAAYLASPAALIVAALFVPYMNQFQIKPEERSLEEQFGEAYAAFRDSVRRWI